MDPWTPRPETACCFDSMRGAVPRRRERFVNFCNITANARPGSHATGNSVARALPEARLAASLTLTETHAPSPSPNVVSPASRIIGAASRRRGGARTPYRRVPRPRVSYV